MHNFDPSTLAKIYTPPDLSNGEDNGQVTIIGGSKLFHGAPIFALKAASKIVDMVFFASPEHSMRDVAAHLKSSIASFIWVPWEEVDKYIEKSDAILIGNGFMRYSSEHDVPKDGEFDEVALESRAITKQLLLKYSEKKWVIDAGSLQVMDPEWIPKNAILTPNKKEYKCLFKEMEISDAAKKYNCIIVRKGPVTLVCSDQKCVEVHGGNGGMTKGGTGDVMAGLTVALLAKNDPFLAATAAAYIIKRTADELKNKDGYWYSAEELAANIKLQK